jgi:hypothetical protein
MIRIDTFELPRTNSCVLNQAYEFVFTTLYPLMSPHIRLQIKERYCMDQSIIGGHQHQLGAIQNKEKL